MNPHRYIAHSCNRIDELEKAKANGAEAVHCLVWLTKSGNLVVGNPNNVVPDLELDAEGMESLSIEEIDSYGLMTLRNWLRWCLANDMAVIIELRGSSEQSMGPLAQAIYDLQQGRPQFFEKAIFMTHYLEGMASLNIMFTDFPRYLLWDSSRNYHTLAAAQKHGDTGIVVPYELLTSDLMTVVRTQFQGLKVIAQGVSNVEDGMVATFKANAIIHELDADDLAQVEDWRMGSTCMAPGKQTHQQICNEWNRASATNCSKCDAKLGSEG